MPFLELSHVSKDRGQQAVLHDVSLTIERGEFVAIVGYSGSGKSTLISLIACSFISDTGTAKHRPSRLHGFLSAVTPA